MSGNCEAVNEMSNVCIVHSHLDLLSDARLLAAEDLFVTNVQTAVVELDEQPKHDLKPMIRGKEHHHVVVRRIRS